MTSIENFTDAEDDTTREDLDFLSGAITFDKWMKWITVVYYPKADPTEAGSYGYVNHDFKKVSQSDFLIQHFLSLPLQVQKNTYMLIRNNISAIEIGCALKLRKRLDEPHPGLKGWPSKGVPDWFLVRNKDLMEIVDGPLHLRDKTFFNLVERFSIEMSQRNRHKNQSTEYNQKTTVPYLLAIIHGKERVQECLSAWINTSLEESLEDFAELTERWDEFKEYPISWAVNLVRNESQNQVSDRGV